MSADRAPIRSYQRIFRPERRIYQVEGHRLPVPGGVPLRWLAYAIGALLAILLLSQRSPTVALVCAAVAAACGLAAGDRATALIAGAAALGGVLVAGWAVAGLDWPLRLVVVPALAATLATQATPDGRPAHRFAISWLRLALRPARRSLGRPLPSFGERRSLAARLSVAPDAHGSRLRRARISGPARVRFATPVGVSRGRLRKDRLAAHVQLGRGGEPAEAVELAGSERLEVRA